MEDKMKKIITYLAIGFIAYSMQACEEDTPPNTLQFTRNEASFASGMKEVTVTLTLERPAEDNTPITVEMDSQGITHGNQFTVDPASIETNGTLFLAFPKNEQETSFRVRKLGNPPLNGDETITFEIASAPAPVVIGSTATLEVHFK